jgi:hypothetical protein
MSNQFNRDPRTDSGNSGNPGDVTRRSLLRGLGAGSVMLAGMNRSVMAAETGKPVPRAAFFFHANGSHPGWAPTGAGTAFTLSPHLKPIADAGVQQDVIILRGMTLMRKNVAPPAPANSHHTTTYSALGAGGPVSFDQILAQQVKGTTPLPSLELTIGTTGGAGGKASSLSQVDGTFLPGEKNPLAAYQRVSSKLAPSAGAMQDPAATEKALLAGKSVLDAVIDDINVFRARAGSVEKSKLDVYFDSMRDLEKNLGKFAGDVTAAPACGKEMPPANALTFQAELNDLPTTNRLFLDVMAMALACGATRVASMMWGGGQCNQPITKFGISDWHGTSHGGAGGAAGQAMINMQAHLAGDWAYFIGKLKSYGVLDQTVTVWGTQNGASTSHDMKNTPMLVAGRLGGAIVPGGRIIDCGNRNHNDVYLAIARGFGMNVDKIGDPSWCAGPMPGLLV